MTARHFRGRRQRRREPVPVAFVERPLEQPAITAYQALQQIAANAQSFYNQLTPGQLNTLFAQVAEDIQRGSAGLIDNATP